MLSPCLSLVENALGHDFKNFTGSCRCPQQCRDRVHNAWVTMGDSRDRPSQNNSQFTVIGKESCALTGECGLPPGGDSCPLCLPLLLPLLLLMPIIILFLAFWIRQKYKASKFYFPLFSMGFWIQAAGEKMKRKGKRNQKCEEIGMWRNKKRRKSWERGKVNETDLLWLLGKSFSYLDCSPVWALCSHTRSGLRRVPHLV